MYKHNTPTLVTAGAESCLECLGSGLVNSSVAQEMKADNQSRVFPAFNVAFSSAVTTNLILVAGSKMADFGPS